MAQEPIEITGLHVLSLDDKFVNIHLEINGKWVPIISCRVTEVGGTISHIVEPLGIQWCIGTGEVIQG